MTDIGSKFQSDFVRNEPVIAAHAAAAVVGFVLTALATHGVISTVAASQLTQQIIPPVTALMLLLLGWLVRHFVTPAAKLADRVDAEVVKTLAAQSAPPNETLTKEN